MTNKQAIKFANCLKNNYTIDFNDMADFCNMAIKALEQQPCDDCVSLGVYKQVIWERDIAIEQLKELGYGFGEKIRTSEDCVSRADVRHLIVESFRKNLLGMTFNKMFKTLYKGVDDLSPVTPTHGTCKDCECMKKDKFGHHCCKCHWCVMDSYKDMMEHFYCADFEKRGNSDGSN